MDTDDLRRALRDVTRGFRAQLEWHARAGTSTASAAATPRVYSEALAEDVDEDEALDAVADPAGTHAAGMADMAAIVGDAATRAEEMADSGAHVAARAVPITLPALRADLGDCQRCKLSGSRRNILFGVGPTDAPFMFIGEAPGANEDRLGEPFVGPAGQLLDRMIVAMGWAREEVYIANVLKCRPPGNRNPEADEIAACRPFLARQIDAVRPRIIITLGKPAAHLILDTSAPMNALRGRFQSYRGIKVMPTFHPAYLLRAPERKRDTWEDLKQVIAEAQRLGIEPPHAYKT